MRAEYIRESPGRIAIVPTAAEDDIIVVSLDDAVELMGSLPEAISEARRSMPEILPCPFCGGKARPVAGVPSTLCCRECGARVQGHGWKEAIATWNRRYRPGPTGLVCPPTCPTCHRAEMVSRTALIGGKMTDLWECPRCHAGMGRRGR